MVSAYSDKTHTNTSRAAANAVAQKQSIGKPVSRFAGSHPGAIAQRKEQEVTHHDSGQVQKRDAGEAQGAVIQKETNTSNTYHKPNPAGQPGNVVQLRRIPNLQALRDGIALELNAGEAAAGSNAQMLSAKRISLDRLSHVYTPRDLKNIPVQIGMLQNSVGDPWHEAWFDRVDQRVRSGAQETMGDIFHWANDIQQESNSDEVDPVSAEILGDELHDRGLGATKVTFEILRYHDPFTFSQKTYVVKPEDRSVERVIYGSGDSLGTRMNERLDKGRQVNTLEMRTDPNHGTLMEYVTTTLKGIGESTLRKLHFWDSFDVVSNETIALAFLAGMHDLHNQNVMQKGGAPVIIDGDVVAMPMEYITGPDTQQGVRTEGVRTIGRQMGGDRSGASQILQFAIENPDVVINMITELIGDHRSRIVPVHTGLWFQKLSHFINQNKRNSQLDVIRTIASLVHAVAHGEEDSPGLTRQLGPDQGGHWNGQAVGNAIEQDFDQGVIPHFQYQSSNGTVYYHGQPIWQGTTLAQSMAMLRVRLMNAR